MRALAAMLLLGAACGAPPPVALTRPLEVRPVFTDTNPEPKVVEVTVVAAPGTATFLDGKVTQVWGYRDGAIAGSRVTTPGPTLEANVGDTLIVHFKNELPVPTTVHWHGLRLPPASDGSTAVQNPVEPQQRFDYRFTLRDAGTFWYHPHVQGDVQVERGLYGALVVRGGPALEAAAERLFIVDDVKLLKSGALSPDTDALDVMLGRQGNVLLVNGQRGAQVAVASGSRERWRFINAANGRYFTLRVPGHPFTVVGGDAGALAAPYRADTLMVVPGERYEVLIDFDDAPGTELSLETIFYDRGHGVPDPGPATLLSLEVGAAGSARPGPMPTALVQAPTPLLPVTGSTTTRKLVLEEQEDPTGATETSFTINQQRWPFNTPLMVQVGDTEVWELDNRAEMDHPFHLHGMFFQVLDVAGVPAARLAWKDTVNVPQKSVLRLAVRYETVGMWMYHCHILEHAERGMMGELMVMPPP